MRITNQKIIDAANKFDWRTSITKNNEGLAAAGVSEFLQILDISHTYKDTAFFEPILYHELAFFCYLIKKLGDPINSYGTKCQKIYLSRIRVFINMVIEKNKTLYALKLKE